MLLFFSYCRCVFSHKIFYNGAKNKNTCDGKEMTEVWVEDGWGDLLPGVLSGSVRDVDHCSLAVCVHWEREGRFVRLIRGNELLLHLSEASNGKINAVKDPAGGRENPKPLNPSWTNLTGNNGAACHPFKELFALRVIRSTWTSHTFLETSCHETREPLKQLKASVKWPESASKRSNSRLLPTSLFFQM